MFAWRQCEDDWRDVLSPAEPGLHLSLRCLWGPGAALSVHLYYNNTSPGAEWSHSQMSPMIGNHVIISSCPLLLTAVIPHMGEGHVVLTILRRNVEPII